jgi:hypothetical protein
MAHRAEFEFVRARVIRFHRLTHELFRRNYLHTADIF